MTEHTDLLQGTLEMLVLETLSLAPLHGWGIAQRIQQKSRDTFRVNQGSLYPALKRMRRKGWIRPEWRTTENNRRARYYHLTPAGGRAALHREMTTRLADLPEVTAVGATSWLPATGSGYVWGTLPLTGPRAGEETREISIRLALGAAPRQVVGPILRQAIVLVTAGLALGSAGAVAMDRLLASVSFRTDPTDPRILTLAALILLAAGIAASLLPAYEVLRTPPRETLTEE